MWQQLWDDYLLRVERIRNGQLDMDSVDTTIGWQLEGTSPYARAAVKPPHLPELYSGAPWRQKVQEELPAEVKQRGWIAIVGLNPSLDEAEDFPHVGEYTGLSSLHTLVPYFENRFQLGQEGHPHMHGRGLGGRPTVWHRGNHPTQSRTWDSYERLLRAVTEHTGAPLQHSLGYIAAVVDAVPWKFRAWGKVRALTRRQLLDHGRPYLHWMLSGPEPQDGGYGPTSCPSVIVALGDAAQVALLSRRYGSRAQVAHFNVARDVVIPVVTGPAPAAFGNQFGTQLPELAHLIAHYW